MHHEKGTWERNHDAFMEKERERLGTFSDGL